MIHIDICFKTHTQKKTQKTQLVEENKMFTLNTPIIKALTAAGHPVTTVSTESENHSNNNNDRCCTFFDGCSVTILCCTAATQKLVYEAERDEPSTC